VTPLVLLHGFTGSPDSWADVRAELGQTRLLVPALLGHDGTPGDAAIGDFDAELDRLAEQVRSSGLDSPHVAGYSMGGRVALGLLVRHAELFRGATLIGVNPGLSERRDREARIRNDEEWARLLEAEGTGTFVAAWEALPLFRTQGRADPAALERQRRIRLAHDPHGLARALRVLGLGAMPDFTAALRRIRVRVRIVAGGEDDRFRVLAKQMGARIPDAKLRILQGVGHNPVLESPAEIAALLKELKET
jgi:2-succinyl-6-hydroxy-2,4-cyclohexadiene-1-carboxylate synthase